MALLTYLRYFLVVFLCLSNFKLYSMELSTESKKISYNPFWSIELEGFYLQPNYSMGSFTENYSNTITDTNSETVTSYNSASLAYAWGSKLDLSYHYKENSDVDLNWYQFSSSTKRDLINGTNNLSDNIYDIVSDSAFYSNVLWTLSSQWNAINAEVGQELKLTSSKGCRIHAGLQATEIKTNVTTVPTSVSNALNLDIPSRETQNSESQLSFKGIGPRLGINLFYKLSHHASLFADGATSLLSGKRSFKVSGYGLTPKSTYPFLPAIPYVSYISSSNTIIVPEFDAALGGQYSHISKIGQINAKIGWMWVNYWNALSNPRAVTSEMKTNFGIQGPFLGVKWLSN